MYCSMNSRRREHDDDIVGRSFDHACGEAAERSATYRLPTGRKRTKRAAASSVAAESADAIACSLQDLGGRGFRQTVLFACDKLLESIGVRSSPRAKLGRTDPWCDEEPFERRNFEHDNPLAIERAVDDGEPKIVARPK